MRGHWLQRHVGSVVWLVAVWLVLWGDVSWANLVSGLVVAVGVTVLIRPVRSRPPMRVRPFAMVRFFGVVTWSILKANLFVAWEVLTPTNRSELGVVAVRLSSSDPLVITVVSHAIGLAPGTMVVDIDDDSTVLYVHMLHLASDVEQVRAEVLRLERLALRALRDISGDGTGEGVGAR